MALICASCGKKSKISRECKSLSSKICSTCCGIKRNKEIICSRECKYHIEALKKNNIKEITALAIKDSNTKQSDIYQNGNVVEKVVAPFEQFIFYNFYNSNLNDDDFFQCYMKMYLSYEKNDEIYEYSENEKEIINKFNELVSETNFDVEIEKQILLRIIRSIVSMTGGILGKKGYLELLRGHFTKNGIVSSMFRK